MQYVQKLICFVLLAIIQSLHSEGFVADTIIHKGKNKSYTIKKLCDDVVMKKKRSVATWNEQKNIWQPRQIRRAGTGTINYTATLVFDDNEAHNITCSPIQLFYLPQKNLWIEAYKLSPHDLLYTEGGGTIRLVNISYTHQTTPVYALRIKKNHTFCVGHYHVLTHNKNIPLLPLALVSRIAIAFGSGAIAGGSSGSFLGPVPCAAGITIGGIVGVIATCAALSCELYQYTMHIGTVAIEHMVKHNTNSSPNVYPTQTIERSPTTSLVNIPIQPKDIREINSCGEYKTPELLHSGGCGSKAPLDVENSLINKGCCRAPVFFEEDGEGCLIDGHTQNTQHETKERYTGPWARNWAEFFGTCPIGQQHSEKFKKTGKQNPKDNAPIYEVTETIPGAEMFKKGNLLAPDRMHGGDHFEVWNEDGQWIGAANLDGSMNASKTESTSNKRKRDLEL